RLSPLSVLTRAFHPAPARFCSDDRLRLLCRDHLERSLDDLSLAVKSQDANRFAYFKPARVVDFVVVIGDVTRFETQQKEIHKLVISKLLAVLGPVVPVFDLVDPFDRLGLYAGLFPNLADRGGLGRFA